jgi:hypothetical protein
MIAATVHCDATGCEAWAYAGDDASDPRVVDQGEFSGAASGQDETGWIDGTYRVPAGWASVLVNEGPVREIEHRCPTHAR